MTRFSAELDDIEKRVDEGEIVQLTPRQIIAKYGYERRGSSVVYMVRRDLKNHNLITSPNFEYEWLDGPVTFRRPNDLTGSGELNIPAAEVEGCGVVTPVNEVTMVGGAADDPAYRIGKLDAANRPPLYVSPDAALSEAITLMLRNNYSQLPVMTSNREVKGMVTWQSIATRAGARRECNFVRECMDTQVEIIDNSTSLFRVIELIKDRDVVLVRGKDKSITGIVTVADLSETFHQLGRPFLLLSEIENHLRGIIDGRFTAEELNECKNPSDTARTVNNVSDLTFGEYVRLLQYPEKWEKVGLDNIDQGTFIKDLERVNRIRNDVMHFDPDGIGSEGLEDLRKTARFMQELRLLLKR